MTLLFIISLFFACNNNSKSEQTIATKTTPIVNRDSVRRTYEALLKSKPKLLPAKQIIEPGKIYPVDEGQTDTAFYVFREGLLQILAEKNEFKLIELLGDSIENGFGGNPFGVAAFVEKWKLDVNKDSSQVWQILKNVITQGGVFDQSRDNFVAPYYTATFPDTYDASTVGVLTGEGVRVRAGTNVNSEILKTISYDILPVIDWQAKEDMVDGEADYWVKVRYADKKEGFIYGKFIGSPYDYRAIFAKQPNGSWLLAALVSGD